MSDFFGDTVESGTAEENVETDIEKSFEEDSQKEAEVNLSNTSPAKQKENDENTWDLVASLEKIKNYSQNIFLLTKVRF